MTDSSNIVSSPVSNTGGNSQGTTSYINLEYAHFVPRSLYVHLNTKQRRIVRKRVENGLCELESPHGIKNNNDNPLIIDTLSVTGKIDDFPSKMALTDIDVINEYMLHIQSRLGLTIDPCSTNGMNGYTYSHKLIYTDGRKCLNLGFIAWGGNEASYQMYLTGEACQYIQMIEGGLEAIYDIVSNANQKIKRIDIAYDDLMGEYNIQTALDLYEQGMFRITRNPKIRQVGNFIDPVETDGRTVYVGSRDNGKMMRIYEKGKQLGDKTSPWVRWELELKAVDREIPLDILLKYDIYYKGAYPVLENFIKATVKQVIKTVQKVAEITIDKSIEYLSISYGKVIYALKGLGHSDTEIIQMIIREGIPKRFTFPINKISKPELKKVLSNHSPIMDSFHYQLI